jgi:spore coat polysaccharide biosynthesis protein SpsF
MTGAIVQARMASSRLPGKVMLPGVGKPLLGHLLERLNFAETLDLIVVATSDRPQDNVIEEYCKTLDIPVYRGSECDVLDRYYRAAHHFQLDSIVRITSDCPLIDPTLVDRQVRFAQSRRSDFDLVTNRHPLTYPDGLDFDIMSMEALTYAWTYATEPLHREHAVPYFWDSGMRVHNFEDPKRLYAKHRWTLDYREDYELIKAILTHFSTEQRLITTEEILSFLEINPHLSALNAKYIQ